MKHFRFFFFSILVAFGLQACHKKAANLNANLTLNDYASLDTSAYSINAREIRHELSILIGADKDSSRTDYHTRRYYLDRGSFVWITRKGVDSRADSVLVYL